MSARHPKPRDCSRDYIIPAMPGQAVVTLAHMEGTTIYADTWPVIAWYMEPSDLGPEIIPMISYESGGPQRVDTCSDAWAVHLPGTTPTIARCAIPSQDPYVSVEIAPIGSATLAGGAE